MDVTSTFRPIVSLTLALSIAVVWSSCDVVSSAELVDPAEVDFDWDKVSPSKEFKKWHTCYIRFECARLVVPLDWTNITNPNRVILAVLRLPAKVGRSDGSYGGPIIINPGGPGGSGVDFLLWGGEEIQTNLDGEKFFDIVSFDPRGVQHTTPSSACFNSSLARQLSEVKIDAVGQMDTSDAAFNNKWAQVRSFARVCSESEIGRFPDGSNIHQFASTALVAHDMLVIIDKLEEAREKAKRGPALLQYWGFSYGTLLGNTFASMFPDRIGRLILDGVVDGPDIIATGWTTNIQDSMKTWASFSLFCYEAKQICPLYDPNVKSPDDIALKVTRLLDSLKDDPLPVVYDGTAETVTYSDVRSIIFQSLYVPSQVFPILAVVLADLINGITSSVAPYLSTITVDDCQTNPRKSEGDQAPPPPPAAPTKNISWDRPMRPSYPSTNEAYRTVLCGDGDSIQNRTKVQERAYLDLLLSQSPISGGNWVETSLPCTAWSDTLRPLDRNRYIGPFASKLSDYNSDGKPILWIGNTADPVTPLRNAFKMAATHEGSVVLTVDEGGHLSGPVNPSKCAYEVVRKYVTEGILPQNGTVCKGDLVPWIN